VTSRSFLFVLASTRPGGNSELLARAAAEQLPAGATARWLSLTDPALPPFTDIRHSGDGTYPAPTGAEATLLEATLEATDLVIVSPLYWYALSAPAKLYLDHWSGWLRVPGVDFRGRMAGRTLWGVTVRTSRDPEYVAPMLGTLTLTARYLGMRWGGLLDGYANEPGDVLRDSTAMTAAKEFFA
jgi:multimeric flavodoxin WrbA